MPGNLVISLDFELMWGVRDHRSVGDYGASVLGVRQAIPAMLAAFAKHDVRATWATVGLLFAHDRDEVMDHLPALKPGYDRQELSPYDFIANGLGKDEASDPHHFGGSLVDRILDAPGQEMACHTFSHYFCLEPGQTHEQFRADLMAARAIAAERQVEYASIVFPRNQWTRDHVAIASDVGISAFRGDPPGLMYRPRPGESNTLLVRGLRLVDSVMPIAARNDHTDFEQVEGARNIAASRFLRTSRNPDGVYANAHLRRVMAEMTKAARDNRTYHLWWHPHNFGLDTDANMARLAKLLAHFGKLRERHGMQSRTMRDLGTELGHEPSHGDAGTNSANGAHSAPASA